MHIFQRLYGSVATITLPSWDTLGSGLSYNDASFATSNVSIVKDNGSPAFISTVPTSEISGLVDLTFSAAEMECAKLRGFYFKTGVLTMPFTVETKGHPSAMHIYDSLPTSVLTSGDYANITASCTTALNTYDPPTNTELNAAISAVTADTEDLQTQVGTDGAGLTNLPLPSAWGAHITGSATTALNSYDP